MWSKMCNSEKCAPWALLAMRLVAGAVLVFHGWPKLFGDKTGMLMFFEKVFPFAPGPMLALTGVIEVVGGILLIIGLFTRIVSAVLALEFLYIVLFVKSGWGPREMDLLMLVISLQLHAVGAGSLSADEKFMKKSAAPASTPSTM